MDSSRTPERALIGKFHGIRPVRRPRNLSSGGTPC